MDVAAVNSASQVQATQGEFQVAILRRVLDMESREGADLARLVQQAAGLGRGVDVQV